MSGAKKCIATTETRPMSENYARIDAVQFGRFRVRP